MTVASIKFDGDGSVSLWAADGFRLTKKQAHSLLTVLQGMAVQAEVDAMPVVAEAAVSVAIPWVEGA